MKDFVRLCLFAVLGALVGLGYYYLFGCSGNCTIVSSPWMTMAYVAVIGALLSAVIKKKETA